VYKHTKVKHVKCQFFRGGMD